jgi:drug/metabolite transporter (DMT)-like permease
LWLKWRDRLDWAAILLGVLGAGLSVFPSIRLDIQVAGIPLNVFAIVALVAVLYTSFIHRLPGPDQQEFMRVSMLPMYPGKLSAPPIQRSDSQ